MEASPRLFNVDGATKGKPGLTCYIGYVLGNRMGVDSFSFFGPTGVKDSNVVEVYTIKEALRIYVQ